MIRKKALILKSMAMVVAILSVAIFAVAQTERPAQPQTSHGRQLATMHLVTKLGSFKILDGVGRVEMSFTGTVLVSNLKGNVSFEGDVRKEFDQHNRQAYFGTGKMIVEGEWRAVQWFGRNMSATWHGNGIARLFGEFDEDLETGTYWFASHPDQRHHWFNGGVTVMLPDPNVSTAQPIERRRSGGGE